MSSKKEEERNEKIIRGLMKLPPNRRCINCNSLGPQYVCTNFWTFVCTTCSGIHREFTHRVKSVSMSKFTSQEVEALQKGGNQRARDIYLKDWDLQRQRLPDSSNVERVREFLKSVYVDKRYTGGKLPDKPPRDTQNLRNQEDETRRASSYHSYSQSPPYDYQYEERRYGKQGAVLTRKPGSDRGRYEGNISSLAYSPGRSSEHMYEDRFANDGIASRVSDYSVSSGGHPFKSGSMSPNFEKEAGSGSPAAQGSKNISTEDVQRKTIQTFPETKVKGLADGIRHPQRTASSGTFGSFDSNSTSLQSVNSSNLLDVSEPEQSWGVQQGSSWNFPSLTKASSVPLPVTSSASTFDLFQSSSAENLSQLPHTFEGQPIASVVTNSPHISVTKDEGWAAFDVPQQTASNQMNQYLAPSELKAGNFDAPGKSNWPLSTSMPRPSSQTPAFQGISSSTSTPWNEVLFDVPQQSASNQMNQYLAPSELKAGNFDAPGKSNWPLSTSMPRPSSQTPAFQGISSSTSTPWNEVLQDPQASSNASHPQSWNAFGESTSDHFLENAQQRNQQEVAASSPSLFSNQYWDFGVPESGLQDFSREGTRRTDLAGGSSVSSIPSYGGTVPPSYALSSASAMDVQPHATGIKSTNPFDFQFDSEPEPSNMFMDVSSLQTALPNTQLPSSFVGGVTDAWFPQIPATPYIPTTAQGGMAYIAEKAPNSQLPNVPTQGSVASIGGNPFA